MYGHPADREFANQCLQLWGRRQRYGGPEGYKHEANFIPKARGVPVEWTSDIAEKVGFVVVHCMDAEEQMLVKMYYEPYPDPERDNEPVACNRSFVLKRCKERGVRMSRDRFNDVIGSAIGRVAMALAYPAMLAEPAPEMEVEKKVCNMRK